jgi:anti-sigma-K factor RskA
MKVQELISSGKLELYVAGTLSEREMGDVAASAQEYPEVALEIEKIERAMLDFLSPVEFNMEDKEKERQINQILEKIRDQSESEKAAVVPIFRMGRLAIAAITIGLILMTGLSLWLGLRNSTLHQEMAALRQNQDKLEDENQQNLAHYDKMQQQFTLRRNILTKRVELKNVAGSKITDTGNYMLVYWNPGTRKLMLADANLPALTSDQQYQLWALYDGKPIDAGVFDYKDKAVSVGFQKDISNAQAFAVTVEPKGGSKTPTISNLCMMAKL